MHHRSLVLVLFSAAAVVACAAHDHQSFDPRLVARGEGKSLTFPSHDSTILWHGTSPQGGVSVMEFTVAPGALGAPPHVHGYEDEYSYVLEGTPTFLIGDEEKTAAPGTFAALPRGVRHAYWNAGSSTVRVLVTIVPGGFGKFFEDVSDELRSRNVTDRAEIGRIVATNAARYGCTVFSDQVGPLMQRHGLK